MNNNNSKKWYPFNTGLISLKCDLYSLRNRRKITAKELGTKGVSDELFVLKSKNKIKQNKSQINLEDFDNYFL